VCSWKPRNGRPRLHQADLAASCRPSGQELGSGMLTSPQAVPAEANAPPPIHRYLYPRFPPQQTLPKECAGPAWAQSSASSQTRARVRHVPLRADGRL
jgi:hypothetical protein